MLSNDALIYTLISWVSLMVNLFSVLLVFRSYLSSKSRPLVYLIIIYIFLTPYFIIHSVLYIVGTEQKEIMLLFFRLASFFIIAVVFALVLFIESLRVDKPSSIILIITAMGVGASLLLSSLPDSVQWDLVIGPYLSDMFRLAIGIELVILAIIIIYQISGFIPYIPETIGKNALLFYLATIIPILLPVLLITLKIFARTPGTSTKLPDTIVIIAASSTVDIPLISFLSVRSETLVNSIFSKGLLKFLSSRGIFFFSIASRHLGWSIFAPKLAICLASL